MAVDLPPVEFGCLAFREKTTVQTTSALLGPGFLELLPPGSSCCKSKSGLLRSPLPREVWDQRLLQEASRVQAEGAFSLGKRKPRQQRWLVVKLLHLNNGQQVAQIHSQAAARSRTESRSTNVHGARDAENGAAELRALEHADLAHQAVELRVVRRLLRKEIDRGGSSGLRFSAHRALRCAASCA